MPGRAGPCLAFGAVRAIKILHHYQSFGRQDPGLKLFVQLALFFNAGKNLFLLFLQIAQVIQPFVEITELFVVEGACNLLAVTGNEGDGVAFVN